MGEKIHVSARVIGYYEADDRFPKIKPFSST
ncbi:MAG: hypothetical protein ACLR23_17795 [Clostridia bacterium]